MPGSCCAKPVTRIIKVADGEAGLVGLDQALENVFIAGVMGDEEIQKELLRLVRDFGNYIAPSRESDYRSALLSEYKKYLENVGQEPPRPQTRRQEGQT